MSGVLWSEKVRVGMGAVQLGGRLGSGLEFRMEMFAGEDKMGPRAGKRGVVWDDALGLWEKGS